MAAALGRLAPGQQRADRDGGIAALIAKPPGGSQPKLSVEQPQRFIERFKAGPDKQVVLVLDQAGWHVAKELKIPPNITLRHLPP